MAEAGRDDEALMERTVWKTRFWDILQGEDVKGQRQGPQMINVLSTTERENINSYLWQ